jgi:hypothetical protein
MPPGSGKAAGNGRAETGRAASDQNSRAGHGSRWVRIGMAA